MPDISNNSQIQRFREIRVSLNDNGNENKEPQEEKECADNSASVVEQTNEINKDVLSIDDIDSQLLLNVNNVKIVSKVKIPDEQQEKPTLEEVIKTMALRETSCKGVYCQIHNPEKAAGDYSQQKHYVWNPATHEMVELKGIYLLSSDGHQAKGLEGYSLVFAYQNGYEILADGKFKKDDVEYVFNFETNSFDEVRNEIVVNEEKGINTSDYTVKEEVTVRENEIAENEKTEINTKDDNVREKETVADEEAVRNAEITARIKYALNALYNGDISALFKLTKEYAGRIKMNVLADEDINAPIKLTKENAGRNKMNVQRINIFITVSVCIDDLTVSAPFPKDCKDIDIGLLAEAVNNSVFEEDMKGEDALNVINKYADFFKSYLKNKYGYSDEYLEVVSYLVDTLNISKGESYTEEEINSLAEEKRQELSHEETRKLYGGRKKPKYSSSEVEVMVNEYIRELKRAGHNNAGELLEQFIEKIDKYIISPEVKNRGIYADSEAKFDKFNDIVGSYLRDSINQKMGELQLSDEEKEAFVSKLFITLGADNDIYPTLNLNNEMLKDINKNGDNSSFDEIFDIAMNLLSTVKHIPEEEIDAAETINKHELIEYGHIPQLIKMFGGKQKVLSAEDILNNYNEMKLSDDTGIRKFVNLLDSAFLKYDCFNYEDQKELLEVIISLMNKACGFSGNNLELITVSQLNKNNIFDTMQEIIESKELYYINMINVNGVIDGFAQGETGDCWLLSAIKALSATEAGRQIIKKQISWADDYSSVTVYFAGIDKYVAISAEEIVEAKQEQRLSDGDDDVLVLELAMEKVYGDINSNSASTFWERFVSGGEIVLHIIRGDNEITYLQKFLDKKNNGENLAVTFSLKGSESCTCIDGSTFSFSGDSHLFAITDITSSTVTFVNPWDSNTQYTVTWEEFKNLNIRYMNSISF